MADDVHTPTVPEKVSRSTRWARANRERHNARGADYRAKHPDKAEESVRKYDAEHRAERAAKAVIYRAKNPEKYRASILKHRLANADIIKQRRRAKYHSDPIAAVAKVQAYYRQMQRTDPLRMWIKRVLCSGKIRAKAKGLQFDLTFDYLKSIAVTHCPALGCELIYSSPNGKVWNSASLDRIRPDIGYVCGNVRIISDKANTVRNNATTEEFGRIYNWLLSLDK